MSDSENFLEFSVIVPCFNEEEAIADTLDELTRHLGATRQYEIIVVNDGSSDATASVLSGLVEQMPAVRVITHVQNRGYGAALKTGVRASKAPLIAITDADGTYPNERLLELIDLCADYDMVVGARTAADVQYSRIRAVPKYFLRRWVSWIARQPVPDINSGMRVFRKSLAEEFLGILPDSFSFTITITLAMLTTYRRVLFEPISYKVRVGKSKIKPIRDTLRFSLLILRTGTYFAPLRAFAPIIMAMLLGTALSTAYDVFVLGNLTDKTVLLFLFSLNSGMFAILADMIDKRTSR